MRKAIGIDIGGTNIKAVLINEDGTVLNQLKSETRGEVDGIWQKNIKNVLAEISNYPLDESIVIGLSAPGLANNSNTAISYLPNRLPGLENFNWSEYFGKPTFVLNDAHAALIAESTFGALKNYNNAILVTLGTGVGGAILLEGKLYQGLAQMAGHLGHSITHSNNDEQSILGMPGSLEYALGNYSLEKRSHGKFKNTYDLLESVRIGETFATWLWLDMMRNLSLSICSWINTFSPQAIVIAGGMTQAGDELFNTLNDFIDLYEFRPKGKKTELIQAKFLDFSGAIGAGAFALKNSYKEIKSI
jgi:glucokinase